MCGRVATPGKKQARRALLFVWMALAGCVSVDERQIRPGVFDLSTPANELMNSDERARIILGLRARELCLEKFARLSESRIVDAKGLQTMIWRIACRP
jgi:hypothetical protein